MTSVIIPCYKNKNALYKTIFSCGITPEVEIIIIDDCSGDRYEDIQEYFAPFYPITIIYREKNGGPGCARNDGLKAAKGDYIVFIDCGDVFGNPFALQAMILDMQTSPNAVMISYANFEERPVEENYALEFIDPTNNRLHGKIISAKFLRDYDIWFSEECPRINEDIGFCHTIRMLATASETPETAPRVIESDEAKYIWCFDKNSLVRKNNYEFYYIKQNTGLAYNSLHIIKYAERYKISGDIIDYYVCQHMAFMYVMYISTYNAIPERSIEALAGCQYYYNNVITYLNRANVDMLVEEAQRIIANGYADPNCPFYSKLINLTYPQFLQMLEENRVKGDKFYEPILLDQLAGN